MKTRIVTFILAATAILLSTTAMSAEPVPSAVSAKAIKKTLKKEINYPEFAKEYRLEDDVTIQFRVEEDGSLTTVRTYGEYEELKTYVSDAIDSMSSDQYTGLSGQYVTLKFKFRYID